MKHYLLLLFLAVLILVTGCAATTSPSGDVTSQRATQTSSSASSGTAVGDFAPAFSVTTIEGDQVSLTSLEGKPTLVYFWSTWCPFCAKDFGVLQNVWGEYKDDVEIVAIDLDLTENTEIISEYVKRYPQLVGVNFAPGNQNVLTSYKVRSTTTKYALGKDGAILYAGSGAFDESQWRTLLNVLRAS